MAMPIAIAFALIFATFSSAKGEPSCTRNFDSALSRAPFTPTEASIIHGWKIADVLCCCKTHDGGECCTRVAKCGGNPPGCFCASPSVPGISQLWSVAQDR
jgi:hypothetical protein